MIMAMATRMAKSNRFRLAKQQLCNFAFLYFLCGHFMTTTWKCLISHFVEDGNTRQQLSFSFPELWYSPLEFNAKKFCQHLMNYTRWNKCDKVSSNANSFFKWCFRSRQRHCCLLSSLIISNGDTRNFPPLKWGLGLNPGISIICGLNFALLVLSWFPLSLKTNTSKFQFDLECMDTFRQNL